ncbi:hypothetical protein Fmac_007857 [Flemingia macrophylla]|uniref:Reverse transcriptase domain-containing protein n=1 Tax=Flemingia macrophylla TaxID=520843 RepID=A0ABD1MWK4_9FABA
MVNNYYRELFHDTGESNTLDTNYTFPTLTEEEVREMGRSISATKISHAISSMHVFKAPGRDGIQPIVYQKQWDVVEDDVGKLIQDIEDCPLRVKDINETNVVLIPKVDAITHLKQMRLIGLRNVSYKILSKILSYRLRGLMENIIHPNQSSFIPHRKSSDNIIIVQEVIHSMQAKRGRKGWMMIKIDLEKDTID